MTTVKPRRCLAYGCDNTPKDGDFCAKDLKRLPEELRNPKKVREAIIFLGKKDGYLTADPVPTRGRINDNR